MDYKRTIRRAAVFNFIIALLALIGAVQHWGRDGLGMLQYYTYQSNMLLLWACAVGLYYDIRILTAWYPAAWGDKDPTVWKFDATIRWQAY